jgi:hypothetical protein
MKKVWRKPELKRMVAGAAENGGSNVLDNGSTANPKFRS